VPCSWQNCYINTTATSAKHAINTGDGNRLLVYDSGYWKQQSNSANILAKKMAIYHTNTAIVNHAIGQAGNGLFYDGCEGGSIQWAATNSYCSSKGMRLPSTGEASGWSSVGVPSCGAWTWTSTVGDDNDGYGDVRYVWSGSSVSGNGIYNGVTCYVRCVK